MLVMGGGHIPILVALHKINLKTNAITLLNPPDPKLAREVFLEANCAIPWYFWHCKAPSSFALLLASWRLDFLVRFLSKGWNAVAKRGGVYRRSKTCVSSALRQAGK